MNTRRNAAHRFEEKISYAGVPPLEEDVNDHQVPVNPPPLMDENIRAALFQMSQDITTQAQTATT